MQNLAFEPTEYNLINLADGSVFKDDFWAMDAPNSPKPSLIRASYKEKQFKPLSSEYGLYKYSSWLPVKRMLKGSAAPITYKSQKLAQKLSLENLYICLNGYFPQKGAFMKTCAFKETEAYSVCGRMSQDFGKVLVVASAGNTARAFAKVCSQNNIPIVICVPEDNLSALWFDEQISSCVKLIAVQKGADYFDAIRISNMLLKSDKFIAEGGAKNIARRDGMGTTVLSAVEAIGQIPDFYFQAVGSGTGAIAAWEANLRFIEDGRFGKNKMRLIVSQNSPFLPMYEAWKQDSRELLPYEDNLARRHAEEIDAKVLSNRKPPYSLCGGLYDALKDTNGDVQALSNLEAAEARELFLQTEGVDIHPAAAVATASLCNSVQNGLVSKNDIVMLNITGAGEALFHKENKINMLKPQIVFSIDVNENEVVEKVSELI